MKKLLLAIFALALFTSPIWFQSSLSQINASPTFANTLQNYKIYSDGECNAPNITRDGTTYTLKGNIEGDITIERNGIVLDGAGFTLKGKGNSTGIALYDKNNVTIKNINVENFETGILLGHYRDPEAFLWYDPNPNRSTNCTINNCKISNTTNGISIVGGIECRIIGNQVMNNEIGITFFGSENLFRNNQMKNNTINFEDLTYEKSDVDVSNTINGKPIYYLINQQNITVPADASMVHLEGCSNIIVPNLDIKYAYTAISLFNSSNCKVYGNTLTDNEIGVSLRNSSNNLIIGNKLTNNSNDAIEQYDSENTTIANNLIRANGGGIDSTGYSISGSKNAIISNNLIIANSGCGIQAGTGCNITGNYLEGNGQHGVYFWDMSNSIVCKNNITQNREGGLCFRNGINVTITGNDISKNKAGIEMGMGDLSWCTTKENNLAQNTNFAIIIYNDIKNSSFYLNNFIDNNNGSVQVSIKGRFVWKGDEGYNENSTVFPQYAASYNAWDNGSVGNFWSDNNSTAQGAYKITDRNIDYYPILSPNEFSAIELSSTEVPQELSGTIQSKETESESFPTLIVIVMALIVVLLATAGLLVYDKKRRQK